MTTILYEVCIDWDAENWAATPDFSQAYDMIAGSVSADGVNLISISRGKQKEEGNAPAATLEIRMRPGFHEKYSPYTTDADLTGKIRPWLPVRVRALVNAVYIPLYFGYISAIRIKPHGEVQSVMFYCTDGTDLLARQMITQNPNSTTTCSDGDAIDQVLDAAGWSSSRRNIDKTGGSNLFRYPVTTPY